jgi:hypothetical protein
MRSLRMAAGAAVLGMALMVFLGIGSAVADDGPTVHCNGTCSDPDQECIPRNVHSVPVICPGNTVCPVGGQLGCRPGTPCANTVVWECACHNPDGSFGFTCPID